MNHPRHLCYVSDGGSIRDRSAVPNEYSIRPAHVGDDAFLWRVLYEAAYWRPGDRKPPETEMLEDDHLLRYVSGWGRPGDVGMIAEDKSSRPLGAAWFRLFSTDQPGYGFIDDSIPEVSMAVRDDCRGRGIGTALLSTLLEEAATAGFPALSLSVSTDNPALHLYERLGFVKVKSVEGSWTMRHRIGDSN